MKQTRRQILQTGAGWATWAGTVATGALLRASSEPGVTPQAAQHELIEGNVRFVGGKATHPHSTLAWAKKVGKEGQHPHATILTCADSRLSPEILFDQGIGDLFVVRVAGNVAQGDELGSIEYAVEHLGSPLVVVLGHSNCGAVNAVLQGGELPEDIDHLVAPIKLAHTRAKAIYPKADPGELLAATVKLNVKATCERITHCHPLFERHQLEGKLQVKGAVYDLNTGKVEWLDA